ncbi:MAG: hypothetical protein AAB462_00665 [Patescibacteria group bacterium]
MKKNQKGFSAVEAIVIILVLSVVGFVGWKVLSNKTGQSAAKDTSSLDQSQTASTPVKANELIWQQTDGGWRSMSTPPACKKPMVKLPADISKATSVLYPGQTRGGNYKPHGGFRFDNTKDNKINLTAPFDGFLVRGGRYIAEGEIQYTFDAMNNCGVMFRVGHIRELPDNLQKIANTWPEATASSATHNISPAVFVKQGELMGTKVGITASSNTFFDMGIYDYRQANEASKSQAYQAAHTQDKELSWYAVCWLKDWLPADDVAAIAKLPAGDPASGKTSDYCK